jgi:serine protease Do
LKTLDRQVSTSIIPAVLRLNSILLLWLVTAVLMLPLHAASPVILRLKGGSEISGPMLKDGAEHVVLDLGFTALSIPRSEITEIKASDAAPGAQQQPTDEKQAEDIFYVQAGREAMTVDQNVRRVSESVVQIQTPGGLGSGFIINSFGHVVTNQHVIAGEQEIRVVVYRQKPTGIEKQTYSKVEILAMNGYLDLALLKIDDEVASKLPFTVLGESDTINQGEQVFAIGSPLGLERTVSQGIVSVRGRENSGRWYIQTTTQINPGNSGGPLFNERGEVVGVTNMKIAGMGVEGVGFAIPASLLKLFLKNREAFSFDPKNPNNGFRYLEPPDPASSSTSAANPPTSQGQTKP